MERGSLADFAFQKNFSAMFLNNFIDKRKPQPCSFSNFFGREERIEYFRLNIFRNPLPGILHLNFYCLDRKSTRLNSSH